MPPIGRYHRGALICPNYELRITLRCMADDLHDDGPLQALERHQIVRAFVNERSRQPVGARRVGRGRNPRPLWRLGRGHDHRGATWHDETVGVVWLCACGRHRSGQADDAFQHFDRLIDANIIYPTEGDYRLLAEERARRFIELAPADARELRARAEHTPDVEIRGTVGAQHEVGVISVSVEMVGNELFVAFQARNTYDQLVILLAAFAPDNAWDDWRPADTLHQRPLAPGEVCYCIAFYGA